MYAKNDESQFLANYKANLNNLEYQEEFVRRYHRLVEKLAGRYKTDFLPFEDLEIVGWIGMIAALKRFDPNRNTSFSTFAVATVLGEIKRAFRDNAWEIHTPRRARELGEKIRKLADELSSQEKAHSAQDISQHLNVPEKKVIDAIAIGNVFRTIRLSPTSADPDDSLPSDLISEDTIGYVPPEFELSNLKIALAQAMNALKEDKERQVIYYRFYKKLTQRETGKLLEVSQMQVCRLERRALRNLLAALNMPT